MVHSAKPFPYKLFILILFFCLAIVIYSNTLRIPFHFDDDTSIVANLNIRNIKNIKSIWDFWPTRFITYLSFDANYNIHKFDVFGYHLVNFIIHFICAILVWQLTRFIFSAPSMADAKITGYSGYISLFAGLIFLAHPIQTQGVTYIVQRATSLAALFYLASLNFYLKSKLLKLEGVASGMQKLYYPGSLIMAVAAMFAKEMSISLPIILLLYEFCFFKAGKRLDIKRLTPFLISLLIIPVTMFVTKSVNFIEMKRISEAPINISNYHYFITQFRVSITYLRLLFVPLGQNLDYDYPVYKSLIELPVLFSFLFLIFILFMAARLFSKYRIISFAIFWFFLTLFPESGIIPIKDVIFEHRLYLPMAGYSIFLSSAFYYLFEKGLLKSISRPLFIIVICLASLTYIRNFIWQDEVALWADVIRKSPHKARAYYNRGVAYQYKVEGDYLKEAIYDYTKAIAIKPDYAHAYHNRGVAYQKKGEIDKAISDYSRAIEIDLGGFERKYNNSQKADLDKAGLFGKQEIKIDYRYALAYYNRGYAYQERGKLNEAILDYTKAITIFPRYAKAYHNRGLAYQDKGSLEEAILDYTAAIEIAPSSALTYSNRAVVYFLKKEYEKSWHDVHKVEVLGGKVHPGFLETLKMASKREK